MRPLLNVGLALLAVLALCPKCSEPAETLCSASGKSGDGTCSTEKDIDEEVSVFKDIVFKKNCKKLNISYQNIFSFS